MAFVNRNQAVNNNNQGNNDQWKAKGFLNISIAAKNGGKKKLVGVPLRDGVGYDNERQLLEWLQADPANIEKLAAKLVIEFVEVKNTGFDLD